MELVAGKAVHGGLVGFLVGAGFEFFRGVDSAIRGPPALLLHAHAPSSAASLLATNDAAKLQPAIAVAHSSRRALLTGLLAHSLSEGVRTASVLAVGAGVAGSVSLLRHGRSSDKFFQLQYDPVAAGTGAFGAAYMLLERGAAAARITNAVGIGLAVAGLVSIRARRAGYGGSGGGSRDAPGGTASGR